MNEELEFEASTLQQLLSETEEERASGARRRMPGRGVTSGRRLGTFKRANLRQPVMRPKPRPRIRIPPRLPLTSAAYDTDGIRECNEQIRWVQDSLNRILSLNLPVDGVMNVETRSAVRSFQQRQGLPVTGIVGPDIQQALLAAIRSPGGANGGSAAIDASGDDAASGQGATGGDGQDQPADEMFEFAPGVGFGLPSEFGFGQGFESATPTRQPIDLGEIVICGGKPFAVLNNFSFNQSTLRKDSTRNHSAQVAAIAREIVNRAARRRPVPSVCIVGHTDAVGSLAFNYGLGLQRAKTVKEALCKALGKYAGYITFVVNSLGETDPALAANTPVARAANRRVDVHLLSERVRAEGCQIFLPAIRQSSVPGPQRIREDEFESGTVTPNFGSPLQTPRLVRSNFVSCNPPSAAIAAITGPDPVGTIQAANTRAIKLLDKVINQLQDTRKSVVAGATPASPTVSAAVKQAIQDRFHMNANDRNFWIRRDSRSVDELIRRFRGARQILADGWMKYTCLGTPAPATVTISRGGKPCTVEGCAGERAFTCGGNSRIVLCPPWWKEDLGVVKQDAQATTLLHECFHIYFEFIGDQEKGNIANAHCYAQFVLDLNGLPVPALFVNSCP